MNDKYVLLAIAFVLFLASAYAGRKCGLDTILSKKREFERWVAGEKEMFTTWADKEKKQIRLEKAELTRKQQVLDEATSNLTALPYMARIIADYDTRGLDILASSLDWGSDIKRLKKVRSIREIQAEAKTAIAESKEAEYKLAYALEMFPALEDFLDTEYESLPKTSISELSSDNHDAVRDYISSEEYLQLSITERNQLALNRYLDSRKKTNWQIGRDYELFVGYKYSQKGYTVDYYGSYHGLDDLGRDLIAKNNEHTLIIQCKYWGSGKVIREKHIAQLFGTTMCYCIENQMSQDAVKAVFVTNVTVSDMARKFADLLEISICENFKTGEFPRIKCNINRNSNGEITKIYHLPFDQQYDSCKISKPGEFFAMTVAEAEAAGFRRAYRWHGNES